MTENRKNKILVLEDDMMIAGGLIYALEQENYQVFHAKNVAEGKSLINHERFDLAILDMQLPDGLGTEVHQVLKSFPTAVIFLTVIDDEGKLVKAFEEGAADYVTKPFRLRELLARIKRAIGAVSGTPTHFLQVGDVKIDTEAVNVYLNESLIELTALEYKLLLTFASNKGRVMTRTQILDQLWDATGNFVEDNTLTVYIKRLRSKLGDGLTIQTVRGMGYRVD